MSKRIKTFKVADKAGNVMLTAFGEKSGTVFNIVSPDAGSKPTPENISDLGTTDYQPWGPSNDLPTKWRQKAEKSTTAYPLIARLVEIMFGRGLYYWQETIDANGNITRDFSSVPEIETFLAENDIEKLMQQRMMDLKLSGNMFAEFIINKAKNKIVNVYHLESEFSRLGKVREDKSGFDFLKYTGDWTKPGDATEIPFINQNEFMYPKQMQRVVPKMKFAYQSYFPSPGRTIYAFPPHGGVFRDNGWLDFANSVPEIMNNINKNAKNIQYHVQIPYSYYASVNPEWKMLDAKAQQEFIDATLKTMDDFLSGTENGAKTFYSHFATDPVTQKPLAGWEIKAFNDTTKKDAYITSIQEADNQITRAWGLDSSMANLTSGESNLGAGSGSDKRVGFENQVNLSYASVFHVVEPLRMVGKFNKWPANIKWGFMRDIPTSLNENKSGSKSNI